jgi:hypothetical protein
MNQHASMLARAGDGQSPAPTKGNHMAVYGPWIQTYAWNWWVTISFSRDVGREEAYALLEEYLSQLEVTYRDGLSCVIAQEQKTYSGCGKPSGRVHFHLLVACVANLTERSFSDLWERKEFGGTRVTGAAAHVEPYDPQKHAAYYIFKFLNDPAWDWQLRNLDLISHGAVAAGAKMSHRLARKLKRRSARSIKAAEELSNPQQDSELRRRMG